MRSVVGWASGLPSFPVVLWEAVLKETDRLEAYPKDLVTTSLCNAVILRRKGVVVPQNGKTPANQLVNAVSRG